MPMPIRKIVAILDGHEKRRGLLLLVLILMLGVMETLGVASILPFMSVAGNPELVESNRFLAGLYDRLGFESTNSFLVFLGVSSFIVLIVSLSFSAFTHWVMFRFAHMCNYRISRRLLGTYVNKPYVWFLQRHSADLGKTVLSEVTAMTNTAILPVMKLASKLVTALMLLALVVVVDPLVAVCAVFLLGGLYGAVYFLSRSHVENLGARAYHANEARFRMAQEALGGIKDVKVSGLEQAYLDRFTGPARTYAHSQASHQLFSTIPRYFLEAVAFGGLVLLMILMLLTMDGGLGAALPVLAVFAFAGVRLMPALQDIYQNLSALKFSTRILERVYNDLVVENTQGTEQASARPVNATRNGAGFASFDRIDLNDVEFTYPGGNAKALSRVTIRIKANTRVGIVGPTGAGKTTVIDILLGLIKPDSGTLTVDGIEVDEGNCKAWQRQIGYVPQHIFLIDDTVAANIAFGIKPDEIDMQAVQRATKVAEMHDFVIHQMPDGYQTRIGERGVRLSGGQRQRIGIARALYHDPKLLVLDEATSALDGRTEQAVMAAMENLGREKTVVMIAHRLSTVRDCDRIFLLEHGRLEAGGTFDELARTSATFQEMVQVAG